MSISHWADPKTKMLKSSPKTNNILKEIENTFFAPNKSCLASFSAVIIEMAMGIPALDSCKANK